MTEILDDLKEKVERDTTFSKLAMLMATTMIILLFYIGSLVPPDAQNAYDVAPLINHNWVITIRLACVLGFIFTVISFIRKEPSSVIKWLGGIINFIAFSVLVSAMIYFQRFILFN